MTAHWDATPQRRSRLRRALSSWRVSLAVLVAAAAVSVVLVPLGIAGVRFVDRLHHPLQALAESAQPRTSDIFDRGVKSNDPDGTGFALGVSPGRPVDLLEIPPPEPWVAAPGLGDTATTRHYRQKDLVLIVRIEPCGLARCSSGDSLVYTQVEPLA
jgi:hypothetical protein